MKFKGMSFYLIANALGNTLPPSHTGVWLLVRVYMVAVRGAVH